MKILGDSFVYVQREDLKKLCDSGLSVPNFVSNKMEEDTDDLEFIKFEEFNEIEYFSSLVWLINYNDIKDYTIEEITALKNRVISLNDSLLSEIERYSSDEEEKKLYLKKHKLLENKIVSYERYISYLNNEINIQIPEECLKQEEPEKEELNIFSRIKKVIKR